MDWYFYENFIQIVHIHKLFNLMNTIFEISLIYFNKTNSDESTQNINSYCLISNDTIIWIIFITKLLERLEQSPHSFSGHVKKTQLQLPLKRMTLKSIKKRKHVTHISRFIFKSDNETTHACESISILLAGAFLTKARSAKRETFTFVCTWLTQTPCTPFDGTL